MSVQIQVQPCLKEKTLIKDKYNRALHRSVPRPDIVIVLKVWIMEWKIKFAKMWTTQNWEELQAPQRTLSENKLISVYKNKFQTNNTNLKDAWITARKQKNKWSNTVALNEEWLYQTSNETGKSAGYHGLQVNNRLLLVKKKSIFLILFHTQEQFKFLVFQLMS